LKTKVKGFTFEPVDGSFTGVGVSVQVNTQKAWEAVKELFK
jgi:hypothetical protein